LKKIDSGDQDDCILAVPINDPGYNDITEISQIPSIKLEGIKDFFAQYKRLQKKVCTIEGIFDRSVAVQEVKNHLNNYPEFKE
jgi:inorganic pyrophosphatase